MVPQAFNSSHSNTRVPLPDLSSLRQSKIATMRAMTSSSHVRRGPGFSSYPEVVFSLQVDHIFAHVDLVLKNLIKRLKWIFPVKMVIFPLKMVIFHSFLYVILQFPQLPNFNRFLFSAKAGGNCLRLSCHMCSTSTSNLEPWGGPKSPKKRSKMTELCPDMWFWL